MQLRFQLHGPKIKTEDLALNSTILRCRNRHALRGRGGDTFHGEYNFAPFSRAAK